MTLQLFSLFSQIIRTSFLEFQKSVYVSWNNSAPSVHGSQVSLHFPPSFLITLFSYFCYVDFLKGQYFLPSAFVFFLHLGLFCVRGSFLCRVDSFVLFMLRWPCYSHPVSRLLNVSSTKGYEVSSTLVYLDCSFNQIFISFSAFSISVWDYESG